VGTWSQNPITKAWTLATGGRTVLVASQEWTGDKAVRLRLVDRAHQVAIFVPGSKLGDSGLRVGVDTADATKVSIRPVDFYVIGTQVTTGAGDIPAAAPAEAAHGVAAGTPFTITVRFNKGLMELFVNDADTPTLSWAGAGEHAYASYRHFGFESSVTGAIVAGAELVELLPDAPSPQVEVLLAVCRGDIFASAEGAQMAKIGPSRFVQSEYVSLAEHQGFVYGVDGTNAVEIDPQDYSVTEWVASAGTFPGSTVGVSGSTRCKAVFVDGARIGVYKDPTQPNAVFWSAIDESHDWDTGDLNSPGRAYALTTDLPGLVNEPVTCVFQGTKNETVIGTISGCVRKVGDPALGIPDVHIVSRDHGVSGPRSVCMANDGLAVFHSADGLFVLPSGGLAMNLSETVLTRYLQLSREDLESYWIIAIRDPQRHVLHIFLTPKIEGPAYHVTYDERVGAYTKGQGGFFIDTLPDRAGPTAACIYQGKLLLGTRDGYICVLDDTGTADDGGEAVNFRCGCTLLADGDQAGDTQLEELRITLGAESTDTRFEVWGGATAEEALVGTNRFKLYQGLAETDNPGKPFTQRVRAKAIVVELLSNAAGERPAFEKVEAVASPVAPGRRRHRFTPATPGVPCTPATAATGGDFGSGPGAGSVSLEPLFSDERTQEVLFETIGIENNHLFSGQGPDGGGGGDRVSGFHTGSSSGAGDGSVIIPF